MGYGHQIGTRGTTFEEESIGSFPLSTGDVITMWSHDFEKSPYLQLGTADTTSGKNQLGNPAQVLVTLLLQDCVTLTIHSQSAFTCSKLTIGTLEQVVKYVQS